jgi:NDP-sugar pyrophosphorylase family protein
LTATIPKALIEVAGEPFAHHQLRLLARKGVTRVVYCVGYLGELIVDAVGDGDDLGSTYAMCSTARNFLAPAAPSPMPIP